MIRIAQPQLGDEEKEAVKEVLDSGILAQGPRVHAFEEAFARTTGAAHAVATNSGTAALHIALLAAGIQPGDEVITTPFTMVASANAILFCQAKPVFVDIEMETYNLDADRVEAALTPKTKAILPVHLYGHPCDLRALTRIAESHGLKMIEDACQAHGAMYQGKSIGQGENPACFSFYPTKNIFAAEGGLITTNDESSAQMMRMLRDHGAKEKYRHEVLGYNYRMTDLSAAIALAQLKKLAHVTTRRIENAQKLSAGLRGLKGIILPKTQEGCQHVFHQYCLRVTAEAKLGREALQTHLADRGIQTAVHYPLPVHHQPLYRRLGYTGAYPLAETASQEVLSLPVHPGVSDEDIQQIVNAMREAL